MKELKPQVPGQYDGAKSDISFTVQTKSDSQANLVYQKGKQNLLDINHWKLLAGKSSADFYLTDKNGVPIQRLPKTGDYIKIHLPLAEKNKFDWVRIESIETEDSSPLTVWISLRVRPAAEPGTHVEPEHFFSEAATSNFIITRAARKITAAVRGRNELPNTEPKGLLEKTRNAIVAFLAMLGLNTPQWKSLTKGLLTKGAFTMKNAPGGNTEKMAGGVGAG